MYREIVQFREACGDAHMKTILATGDLGTFTNIYKASIVAMMAGQFHNTIFFVILLVCCYENDAKKTFVTQKTLELSHLIPNDNCM